MAAPLDGLIFDAVYGSWILSLLLFTLGHTNGQTHVYLIASSVTIITKHVAVVYIPIQVSQDGFML